MRIKKQVTMNVYVPLYDMPHSVRYCCWCFFIYIVSVSVVIETCMLEQRAWCSTYDEHLTYKPVRLLPTRAPVRLVIRSLVVITCYCRILSEYTYKPFIKHDLLVVIFLSAIISSYLNIFNTLSSSFNPFARYVVTRYRSKNRFTF